MAKKEHCGEVKEKLAKGVDKLQKKCIRLDGDLKTIKTMLDQKEKQNWNLVQLEEANNYLVTLTSQAWKEEHGRIL